tara:strand:- start:114 stop:320 length:207 start_codon:yes stop_codon:yes gene_type:complete
MDTEDINIIIYKDDIKRLGNIIERLRSDNIKQSEEIIILNKKINEYEKIMITPPPSPPPSLLSPPVVS